MTTTPVRSRRHLNNVPHMVYELYDRNGGAVYVGCTSDIAQRLASHRRQPWWPHVYEVHANTHLDRDTALRVEASTIAELQPRWNLTHTEAASESARARHRRRKQASAEA